MADTSSVCPDTGLIVSPSQLCELQPHLSPLQLFWRSRAPRAVDIAGTVQTAECTNMDYFITLKAMVSNYKS